MPVAAVSGLKPANPLASANFDEHEELDEETTGHLHKELAEADEEDSKYPQGRPGSFLNRLISHGNKKTEDQIAAEIAAGSKSSTGAQERPSGLQPDTTTGPKPAHS